MSQVGGSGSEPWFVVEEPWPTVHPTGLKRFPYQAASKSSLPMNLAYISGPYATKADAQAAVNQQSSQSGGTVTGGTGAPQSQAGNPDIHLPSWSLVFGDTKGLLIRILKVAFGGILIVAGVMRLTGADKDALQIIGGAVKTAAK